MLTLNADAWLESMRGDWRQGEHVALLGPTGSGKTSIARELLDIRDYVVVFGFKQYDETLSSFKRAGYEQIKSWPPDYDQNRVILWLKPGDLSALGMQHGKAYAALNAIFKAGGWTVFLDDTGYVAGVLKLHTAVVVLLNQGRSSGISVVTAMTQPSSIVQRIPTETIRQVRHFLVFKYSNQDDIDKIRKITGHKLDMSLLQRYTAGNNRWSDFYAISHGEVTLVRNDRR